ncbi:MAG: Coenzyme F420 hydrogenase/dehydrogenase, beta subunit C-terminal domain [Spirochaetes bacterium]|nr:Coenzyme F420 hydrogenase/dehydrogenase, beta subunit C-terminal domain [Spirochaetota bacterium]
MTFGPKELQADVQQKNMCIGCGACVSICPYFKTYKGKTAAMFQCSRESGRCYAYCPKTGVNLDRISEKLYNKKYSSDALGNLKAIYTSEKSDKASKGNFQNGGTVSALMEFALKNKTIDSAILTKRNGAVSIPEIVTDHEKVHAYASSKYGLSPVVSKFNEGAESGYKKIGVVGTPCSIIAMANIRSNPTDIPDFVDKSGIVIGLFCTWALDTSKFEDALKDKIDLTLLQKVDIPPPPADVMTFTTSHNEITLPLSEMRKGIPLGCTYCHDMTGEFADISVGALELKGEKNKNIIIVRTERGEQLVNDAVKSGYIKTAPLPAEALSGLSTASMNKKKRAFTRLVDEKMINNLTERPMIVVDDQSLKNIMNEKGGM